MRTTRTSFSILPLVAGAAFLFLAAVATSPAPALACGDKDAPCACGAACPSQHQGSEGQGDKKACGCAGAAGAAQRAVIDPATGQLVEPSAEQAAAVAEAAPAASLATPAGSPPQAHPVEGGGVMATFPAHRASQASAHVDETGNAHANCGHAAE